MCSGAPCPQRWPLQSGFVHIQAEARVRVVTATALTCPTARTARKRGTSAPARRHRRRQPHPPQPATAAAFAARACKARPACSALRGQRGRAAKRPAVQPSIVPADERTRLPAALAPCHTPYRCLVRLTDELEYAEPRQMQLQPSAVALVLGVHHALYLPARAAAARPNSASPTRRTAERESPKETRRAGWRSARGCPAWGQARTICSASPSAAAAAASPAQPVRAQPEMAAARHLQDGWRRVAAVRCIVFVCEAELSAQRRSLAQHAATCTCSCSCFIHNRETEELPARQLPCGHMLVFLAF